jgi:hypothetical protein
MREVFELGGSAASECLGFLLKRLASPFAAREDYDSSLHLFPLKM